MKPFLTYVALLTGGVAVASAQITYLDAVEGADGNTFATGGTPGDTSWINPEASTATDNERWRIRPFGNEATVFQALHTGTTMPELTTRITGLGDGTHQIWVFFWDGPNANQWTISAGLESGSLTTYSHDGPGNTTAPVAASTLTFTNQPPPMTTESPRILYGVLLGEATVVEGSPVEVFIDNTAGGGSNNRTWYDGVGHALVEPERDEDNDGLPDSFEQMIIDADDRDDIEGLEDVMGTGAAPAVTDFDNDGLSDAGEFTRGTNPLLPDTDNDGLLDGVETGTGVFIDETDTGTDPRNADSDNDGTPDGAEVSAGTDPNDPSSNLDEALLAVEFNRSNSLGAPSQSHFRIISGSSDPAENNATYTKKVGAFEITVSRPDGENLEFRGANGDSSRAIPGGDTSRSFLVADFLATRSGQIDFEISGLPAGRYVFRSFHLDPFTGFALGFAQGASLTTPNRIEARHDGAVRAGVTPTALGSSGLNTTFIDDGQIPTLSFEFTHDGSSPAAISLRSTLTSEGGEQFLFLNGFQLFRTTP